MSHSIPVALVTAAADLLWAVLVRAQGDLLREGGKGLCPPRMKQKAKQAKGETNRGLKRGWARGRTETLNPFKKRKRTYKSVDGLTKR